MNNEQELQMMLGIKEQQCLRLMAINTQLGKGIDKMREALKEEPEMKNCKPGELVADIALAIIARLKKETQQCTGSTESQQSTAA